ncbi:trichoplein keratin filament-binding protein [Lutzomyia longipalpis]|uniref:trichoplein keratin filament-binding protein n=1 Tax=Lutzomyia longipalpis TaxID=7200 RepID=UPI00248342AA|nr:trichoplein keratin filament-binding protein [Lutzomyia longipalpis]
MTTQMLLKKWARQREMQEQNIEKSRAAKNFFDKNRNLTSHFESWTTSQFYENSSQKIERTKETRRREEELCERRQRLRELRDREEQEWQRELQEGRRQRHKIPTKCLTEINYHIAEEEKRKNDLENQLYSRWRLDATRDKVIHESRSTHEALAKLSWLDRQVEQNMEREKRDREAAEREQRMQEETERQERLLEKNRQVLDSQMRELHSLQETHMNDMQRQDAESRALKEEENQLRERLRKIEELFQMWQNKLATLTGSSTRPMHNLRRIKMLLDMRIRGVRERIEIDVDFLKNLFDATDDVTLKPLMDKFYKHMEETASDSDYVRNLYDSEAKSYLMEREVIWSAMAEMRERLIRHSVTELLNRTNLEIERNIKRYQELSDIKATHLRALDHTNDLLRELKRDHSAPQHSPRVQMQIDTSSVSEETSREQGGKQHDDCYSIVNQLSSQRITPRDDTPLLGGAPRFGRKKIAWR